VKTSLTVRKNRRCVVYENSVCLYYLICRNLHKILNIRCKKRLPV